MLRLNSTCQVASWKREFQLIITHSTEGLKYCKLVCM